MIKPTIVLPDETISDAAVISEVIGAAFKPKEISSHTEKLIIAALRSTKVLTVSLVAEVGDCFPQGNVTFHEGFKSNDQQAHQAPRLRRALDA